jgi:hypothetical protein
MTVIINGSLGITYPSNTTQNTAYQTRFKNRFINGNMVIAQRGSSANVTAGNAVPTSSTGYPCVDRWFVYSAGANVAVAQVAGSGNNQNNLQITGAANVTAIGVGQRIENNNSYDLAGQTVTLSVGMSNSLLSNVTWTASYANTSNTFGTIGTPTKVQISTGTFTVNSTFSQYSTQIAVPANATTGVEVILSVGAQTSGTLVIGNAQLELGNAASSFEVVDYGTELLMCQRYYQTITYSGFVAPGGTISASQVRGPRIPFLQTMRANPTITLPATGSGSGQMYYATSSGSIPGTIGSQSAQGIQTTSFLMECEGYSGTWSGGGVAAILNINGSASMTFSAEL